MIKQGKLRKNDLYGYPWGKIFRSNLFDNIIFPEQYWYEDTIMRMIIYEICDPNKIYGTDKFVYKYRNNFKGISKTAVKKKKSLDSLWIALQLHKERNKLKIKKDQDYYEFMLQMFSLSYKRIRKQPAYIRRALYIVLSSFIEKEFEGSISLNNVLLERAIKEKRYVLFQLLSLTR